MLINLILAFVSRHCMIISMSIDMIRYDTNEKGNGCKGSRLL